MSEGAKRSLVASTKQRLINRAKQDRVNVNLYWTRYASERLLYRLSLSSHADHFILKGAMLFAAWSDLALRPTMDLDLLGFGEDSVDRLVQVFYDLATMQVDPDDGLTFDHKSIRATPIREDQEYQGKRVFMRAHLGNIPIKVQVDIGFGDIISPQPEQIDFPTLLDLPAPRIRTSTKETVIAEKFHVMVVRGLTNSRLKDYFDIWILAQQFDFDRHSLITALRNTFERRSTPIPDVIPVGLTERYAEHIPFARAWERLAKGTPAEGQSLVDIINDIQRLITICIQPNDLSLRWQAGGPWQ